MVCRAGRDCHHARGRILFDWACDRPVCRLFLDDVAGRVEAEHYPGDRPGAPVPFAPGLFTAFQFAAIILLVHLTMLPFVLFGLGALGMVIGNAYLLGREYFQMTGMRHLPPQEARAMRKRNAGRIFAAGLIPAFFAFVPLGNLIMPLFYDRLHDAYF